MRKSRDALFVDADTLRLNCGRCGRELLVKLEDVKDRRTVERDKCLALAADAVSKGPKQPE